MEVGTGRLPPGSVAGGPPAPAKDTLLCLRLRLRFRFSLLLSLLTERIS